MQAVNKAFKSELDHFPGVDTVCVLWWGGLVVVFFVVVLCLCARRMSFYQNFFSSTKLEY